MKKNPPQKIKFGWQHLPRKKKKKAKKLLEKIMNQPYFKAVLKLETEGFVKKNNKGIFQIK